MANRIVLAQLVHEVNRIVLAQLVHEVIFCVPCMRFDHMAWSNRARALIHMYSDGYHMTH